MGDPRELPPDLPKEQPQVRPAPFSDAAINAALDRARGDTEPGDTFAFIAVAEKVNGQIETRMTISVNWGHGWSFGGFVEGDVRDPLSMVGAELRFSR